VTARIVSLVPSISETLLAWGLEPVAVTKFCEQPGLTTVGGTKNPDVAAIVALAPDVVVVDREENRREDAAALTAAGLTVHVTHVRAVSDVGPMLTALRRAVGLTPLPVDGEAGGKDAAGAPAARPGARLRVWVPIWRRPWMTISAATYGSSVLDACGVVNVFASHPDPYPTVTLDEVRAQHPDVVLAPTEPYTWAPRHRHLFDEVAPMTIVDGKDLFWWGARTTAGIERLRTQLRTLGR
jgi:ABC-type Fe3+-hydroxamate transport system substrate-binding protein